MFLRFHVTIFSNLRISITIIDLLDHVISVYTTFIGKQPKTVNLNEFIQSILVIGSDTDDANCILSLLPNTAARNGSSS